MTNITKKEENKSRWNEIYDRAHREREYRVIKMLEKLDNKGNEQKQKLSLKQK